MMSAPADKPRFTAKGLAHLCGISERTVRFYVEEGLLPPPSGRGRGAHYAEDHLTRLRLIRAMQQAGNELETIGEYMRELEAELSRSGAAFEAALAVWNGRNEQNVWREAFRRRWGSPEPLHRYRVAEGVELLVDGTVMRPPARMQAILRLMRRAFEGDD